MLSNRLVWAISVVLAVACVGSAGYTFERTRHHVAAAEDKIKKAADNVIQLERDDETE